MADHGRCDILFSTDRFNLSHPQEYFINDCCYGDDAAGWLGEQLRARGWSATKPDQEDWGWYLDVGQGETRYFIGVGGVPDDDPPTSNRGEWRLMVQKHRTLWERLRGANRLKEDDALIGTLHEIVAAEPGFLALGTE